MFEHVTGYAEVESQILGGELGIANIDPRRVVVFGAAKELFDELVEQRIMPLIQKHAVRIACSFGKDSTLLLALMVEGHRRAKQRGMPVAGPLIVTHGDTRIESPVMHQYALRQMRLLESYLDQEGIGHRLITASPHDRYSWPVMYVGGLKLLTVGASSTADCSIVLKQDPLKKVERELAKEFPEIVTATGVRLDESASRAQSIRDIGLDSGEVIIQNGNRDVAPIVDLITADVWLLLRCLGEGASREYGDSLPYWDESTFYLRRMYDDQDDSQCPITGTSSLGQQSGCGGSSLRSGCALCTVVNSDKQAETLTDLPHFPQLENLLAIRNWLSRNFSNMSYRRFIARKPNDSGYLKLQANTFNESWMTTVLRWLLQADRDEQHRAAQFHVRLVTGEWVSDKGVQAIINDDKLTPFQRISWLRWYLEDMSKPTFQLVTPTQLLLIDALWSRDGYRLAPFTALSIWKEVYHQGISVPFPPLDGERFKDPIPEPMYFPIARDPELMTLSEIETTGVFSRYLADLESLSFGRCGAATKLVRKEITTKPIQYGDKQGMAISCWFGDTITVPDVTLPNEGECGYSIDKEAAEWITGPMIDDYLKDVGELDRRNSIALRRLLSEGVLSLSERAQRNTARLMARAELYERAGMSQLEDGNPIMLAQCISHEEYERRKKNTADPELVDVPAAAVWQAPCVTQQWADLEIAIGQVLTLAKQLECRRLTVGITVNQMGQAWLFDGVNYSQLQQAISQQSQAIQQIFSRPERLLNLLPPNASLQKGRGREQTQRLRLLQQRAMRSLQEYRLYALELLDEALQGDVEGSSSGLLPVFVRNGGGMGILKDIEVARDYVQQLQRLYGYTRLAKCG